MKKTLIIGISSKMGCGKDYINNNYVIPFLENNLRLKTLQISLADQIKVNVMTKMNINYDDVYVQKNTYTRRLLQLEGTENGREKFGKDIWINYFKNWVSIYQNRGINAITCCDIRFKNELEWFKSQENTLLIRIVAPKRNHQKLLQECDKNFDVYNVLKKHISECDLDDVCDDQFDFVIKNDPEDNIDLNDLYKKIEKKLI